ncbi:MAG: hypothetical protein IJ679_10070 [Lachnospiraceae bacterium]|nr:hypothetical protein [Lachnospiraceae bacterium]
MSDSNVSAARIIAKLQWKIELLEKENLELREARLPLAISEERKAKWTSKDSVFSLLFEDDTNLFKLYKRFHPEDSISTEDDLRRVTLKPVFVNQQYNDLGFLIGNRLLIMLEVQSKWSKNIVFRMLLYLAWTWDTYAKILHLDIYGNGDLYLPKPELYVVYTGPKGDRPDDLSLSKDVFHTKDLCIDVKVKVIFGEEIENAEDGDGSTKNDRCLRQTWYYDGFPGEA